MRQRIHVWPQKPQCQNGGILLKAVVESPKGSSKLLWYHLAKEEDFVFPRTADHFVCALAPFSMHHRCDMEIHGEVSAALIQNLPEFMKIWSSWLPHEYACVEIKAEKKVAPLLEKAAGNRAITIFSGGVDSSFTVYSHRKKISRSPDIDLQTALLVHGFDIPLTDTKAFETASGKYREIVGSAGLGLKTIATNLREFDANWEFSCGAALASCLSLFRESFSVGIVPSSEPEWSSLIWGSNALTDPLFSSKGFKIIYDGGQYTRAEKIGQLIEWSEALENLRVCWEGSDRAANCCRCEKCVRTILTFRVYGAGRPLCFGRDVTDEEILRLKLHGSVQWHELNYVFKIALSKGISDPWVKALRRCLVRNKYRCAWKSFKVYVKGLLPRFCFRHDFF